jgi:hypothetical protein
MIQQGGYVVGRIEDDWVITMLDERVDLLGVTKVVCRVWEEDWVLQRQ